MNRLPREQRARVIACLVEGNSIRATSRLTGAAVSTVLTLLAQAGEACSEHMDREFRGLTTRRLQFDELWSFVYSKEKNVPLSRRGEPGIGDVWTWVAIDADSKLVPSFFVGERDLETAIRFTDYLKSRLANRVQITTDGLTHYLTAVEESFGMDVDYAQLQKVYGVPAEGERRYTPAVCIGAETRIVQGLPDPKHINTSYIERQNLTVRMHSRRFTRLTNAFSKKIANHIHALSLHYCFYNYARPHKTLKGDSPAMAAGLADHVWSIAEIVELVEAKDAPAKKRGPYKPRQPMAVP